MENFIFSAEGFFGVGVVVEGEDFFLEGEEVVGLGLEVQFGICELLFQLISHMLSLRNNLLFLLH